MRFPSLAVAAVSLASLVPVAAQTPSTQTARQLKTLTIEELMEIDVTSVSRRAERVSEAAASIQVLTREEIRRSGATSLPEVLRLVTGLQVARLNNGTWAIAARGFNITTSNKLLVLIDGRSVYTPLYSGVFWDKQDLMLEDLDRIEVIRGPGATLWGANAVNGIINIITRSARETQGGLVSLGAGNEDRAMLGLRYGGKLGARTTYRAYAKRYHRDGAVLSPGEDADDAARQGQGGFRADWDGDTADATFQGDIYAGRFSAMGREDTEVTGGNLLARYSRSFSANSVFQVQSYFDRTHRLVPVQFEERRNTWDIDAQMRTLMARRHNLVAGLGYRVTSDRTERSPLLFFDPADRTSPLLSSFVEDTIELRPALFATVGSKFEHNDYTGWEVQPTVRLRWSPTGRQTVWGTVSRAVRAPTRFDSDLRIISGQAVLLRGDPDFQSENLVATEGGYRIRPTTTIAIDLSVYHNSYDDLRSLEQPNPSSAFPIVLGNTLRGRASGMELTVNLQPVAWLRGQMGYGFVDLTLDRAPGSRDIGGGVSEANDAKHQFNMQWYADLPGGIELDGGLRRIGALPNPIVEPYTEANLRLGVSLTPLLDLSFVGQNLLHDHHQEFASGSTAREEFERSAYANLTWRF